MSIDRRLVTAIDPTSLAGGLVDRDEGVRRRRDSTGPCGRPKGPKTMNYHVESGPNFGGRSNASSECFDSNEKTTSGEVNA